MNIHANILIILILAAVHFSCSDDQKDPSVKPDKNESKTHSNGLNAEKKDPIYYTCPMLEHKHIAENKPGKCSECQMDLVAAVEAKADSCDYYGCPMESHSHVRTDKPGVCPDCGMDLKPMQLIEIKINY